MPESPESCKPRALHPLTRPVGPCPIAQGPSAVENQYSTLTTGNRTLSSRRTRAPACIWCLPRKTANHGEEKIGYSRLSLIFSLSSVDCRSGVWQPRRRQGPKLSVPCNRFLGLRKRESYYRLSLRIESNGKCSPRNIKITPSKANLPPDRVPGCIHLPERLGRWL